MYTSVMGCAPREYLVFLPVVVERRRRLEKNDPTARRPMILCCQLRPLKPAQAGTHVQSHHDVPFELQKGSCRVLEAEVGRDTCDKLCERHVEARALTLDRHT